MWSRGHKAQGKGHKKIRGQGQPFQGQTLSRPRTGTLKAKDQGHKRKCSPKEKLFKKIFQTIPIFHAIEGVIVNSFKISEPK